MDIPALSARLDSLALSSSAADSTASATPLSTYFFTPKSGSKHPGDETKELKLVVVALEHDKNLGAAKALATSVGLKDMRAISGADLEKLIGRKREEASPLSVPTSLTPATLLITSASLSSNIVLPSPTEPSSNLTLTTSGDWAKIVQAFQTEGAALKTVEFGLKSDAPAPGSAPAPRKEKAPIEPKEGRAKQEFEGQSGVQLGMTVKKEQSVFGEWYQQVLMKSDMLEYYDISGCYILKPWSYGIWQEIQTWFDVGIKELGVQNSYFPMFVSSKVLEREKDHIEGFAPEVAWVTRAGKSDLEEPIAIRPTSETVMYPYYAKWIRSHRDLPLKLNQWNSVVRWEFKNPQPFLRTREFLWQEGHTAFLTKAEADTEVLQILDLYRGIYEQLLAVPVIPGVKSEKEKFAGGLYTTTVEGFIPTTGRGIQGGTSHGLGQNFSKMFNIVVEDPANTKEKIHVWQNSWGFSTRSIGVMVMTHGDDTGLVLPPRVAQIQVVIVPTGITAKTTDEERKTLEDEVVRIEKELIKAGVKAKADLREGYTPAWKYADWELKGVPVRLELGPKDLAKKVVTSARRDTLNLPELFVNGKQVKTELPLADLTTSVPALLDTIQKDMLDRARAKVAEHITVVTEWKDFVPTLNNNSICVIPWCDVESCEDAIKDRSAKETADGVEDEKAPSAGAKSLCIPHDQSKYPKLTAEHKCPACGEPSKHWTLFGRSY